MADKPIIQLTARIGIDKQESLKDVTAILEAAQAHIERKGNILEYKITGDDSQLKKILKDINSKGLKLDDAIKLEFDRPDLERQLSALKEIGVKEVGVELGQHFAKAFSEGFNKVDTGNFVKKILGDDVKDSSENVSKAIKVAFESIKEIDFKNIVDPKQFEESVVLLNQISDIITKLGKDNKSGITQTSLSSLYGKLGTALRGEKGQSKDFNYDKVLADITAKYEDASDKWQRIVKAIFSGYDDESTKQIEALRQEIQRITELIAEDHVFKIDNSEALAALSRISDEIDAINNKKILSDSFDNLEKYSNFYKENLFAKFDDYSSLNLGDLFENGFPEAKEELGKLDSVFASMESEVEAYWELLCRVADELGIVSYSYKEFKYYKNPPADVGVNDKERIAAYTRNRDSVINDINNKLKSDKTTSIPLSADLESLKADITKAISEMEPPEVPLSVNVNSLETDIKDGLSNMNPVDINVSLPTDLFSDYESKGAQLISLYKQIFSSEYGKDNPDVDSYLESYHNIDTSNANSKNYRSFEAIRAALGSIDPKYLNFDTITELYGNFFSDIARYIKIDTELLDEFNDSLKLGSSYINSSDLSRMSNAINESILDYESSDSTPSLPLKPDLSSFKQDVANEIESWTDLPKVKLGIDELEFHQAITTSVDKMEAVDVPIRPYSDGFMSTLDDDIREGDYPLPSIPITPDTSNFVKKIDEDITQSDPIKIPVAPNTSSFIEDLKTDLSKIDKDDLPKISVVGDLKDLIKEDSEGEEKSIPIPIDADTETLVKSINAVVENSENFSSVKLEADSNTLKDSIDEIIKEINPSEFGKVKIEGEVVTPSESPQNKPDGVDDVVEEIKQATENNLKIIDKVSEYDDSNKLIASKIVQQERLDDRVQTTTQTMRLDKNGDEVNKTTIHDNFKPIIKEQEEFKKAVEDADEALTKFASDYAHTVNESAEDNAFTESVSKLSEDLKKVTNKNELESWNENFKNVQESEAKEVEKVNKLYDEKIELLNKIKKLEVSNAGTDDEAKKASNSSKIKAYQDEITEIDNSLNNRVYSGGLFDDKKSKINSIKLATAKEVEIESNAFKAYKNKKASQTSEDPKVKATKEQYEKLSIAVKDYAYWIKESGKYLDEALPDSYREKLEEAKEEYERVVNEISYSVGSGIIFDDSKKTNTANNVIVRAQNSAEENRKKIIAGDTLSSSYDLEERALKRLHELKLQLLSDDIEDADAIKQQITNTEDWIESIRNGRNGKNISKREKGINKIESGYEAELQKTQNFKDLKQAVDEYNKSYKSYLLLKAKGENTDSAEQELQSHLDSIDKLKGKMSKKDIKEIVGKGSDFDLTQSIAKQKNQIDRIKKELEDGGRLTDELKEKIQKLYEALSGVSNTEGLRKVGDDIKLFDQDLNKTLSKSTLKWGSKLIEQMGDDTADVADIEKFKALTSDSQNDIVSRYVSDQKQRLQRVLNDLNSIDLDDGNFTDDYKKEIERQKNAVVNTIEKLSINSLIGKTTDELKAEAETINGVVKEAQNKSKSRTSAKNIKGTTKQIMGLRSLVADLLSNSLISSGHETILKVLQDELQDFDGSSDELEKLKTNIMQIRSEMTERGEIGKSFLSTMSEHLTSINAQFIATYFSFQDLIRYGKHAAQTVTELDTALTEMRKVSDESVRSLKLYQKESFDVAGSIGTTALALQNSTADWMRLGESLSEAAESAKDATILMNVSEFDNISDATNSLVSMSQAYKNLDKMEIIDVLNKVGNEYSISTSGLATALQDAAAVLSTQGNDLYKATALITAGNAVTQDPSKTSGGIRTIALRIAGTEEAKNELADLGEDVDDFVVQTRSKTQQTIKDYTKIASTGFAGVDVLDANGNLRDTYDILLDIAKVYKQIQEEDLKTGTNRAQALVEYIAGKNRSNIASSILLNPELLENVYASAMNSQGSADVELAKYLDSIEGKVAKFKNSIQELEFTLVNSNILKFFVDLGTTGVGAINKVTTSIGGMNTLLLAGAGILGAQGKGFVKKDEFTGKYTQNLFSYKDVGNNHVGDAAGLKAELNNLIGSKSDINTSILDELYKKYQVTGDAAQDCVKKIATGKATYADLSDYVGNAVISLEQLKKAFLAALPNMLITGGIALAVKGFSTIIHETERLKDAAKQIGSEYKSSSEELESYRQRVQSLSSIIHDSSSTIAETTNARKELISIQDDLINKYGAEEGAIEGISQALTGANDKFDEYINKSNRAAWEKRKGEFDNNKDAGPLEKFINKSNSGYTGKSNTEILAAKMNQESVSINLGDIVHIDPDDQKFIDKLQNEYGIALNKVEFDHGPAEGNLVVQGDNLEDIYNKLVKIQSIAKDMGVSNGLSSEISRLAFETNDFIESYRDYYNGYILNEKILGSSYENSYSQILDSYDNYRSSLIEGKDVDLAKSALLDNLNNAISNAIENGDTDVAKYIKEMYPQLSKDLSLKLFHDFTEGLNNVKISDSESLTSKGFDSILQTIFDNSAEKLKNYNPNIASQQEKDAYRYITSVGNQFGFSDIDAFAEQLVSDGRLKSERQEQFERAFGKDALGELPESYKSWIDQLKASDLEACESIEDVISKIRELKDAPSKGVSASAMISDINALSDGFHSLDNIAKSLKDKKNFDFTLLDDDKFKEFSKYKDEYEKFVTSVSSNPGNFEANQAAFNDLVDVWLRSTDVLKNVDESTKIVTESMLKNMGVTNSSIIVEEAIIQKKAEEASANMNLSDSTEATIESLLDEAEKEYGVADASEEARIKFRAYVLQKQMDFVINTGGDISALAAECQALGLAANAWKNYYAAKRALDSGTRTNVTVGGKTTEYISYTGADGKKHFGRADQIEKEYQTYQKNTEKQIKDLATKTTFDGPTSPAGSGGGSNGGGNSEKQKDTYDWIERKIQYLTDEQARFQSYVDDTNNSYKMQITYLDEVIRLQKEINEAYGMADAEYLKNFEEVSKGISDEMIQKIKNGDYSVDYEKDEQLKKAKEAWDKYYENHKKTVEAEKQLTKLQDQRFEKQIEDQKHLQDLSDKRANRDYESYEDAIEYSEQAVEYAETIYQMRADDAERSAIAAEEAYNSLVAYGEASGDIEKVWEAIAQIQSGTIDLSEYEGDLRDLLENYIQKESDYEKDEERAEEAEEDLEDARKKAYEKKKEYVEAQRKLTESLKEVVDSELKLIEATGALEIEAYYNDLIGKNDTIIDQYYEQLDVMEERLDELDEESADYYEIISEMESINAKINDAAAEQAEWNHTIMMLPIKRIEKYLNVLGGLQDQLKNFISYQQTIGQVPSKEEYQQQIKLSQESITKMKEQLEQYKKVLKTYEYGSEKYDETISAMKDVVNNISQAAIEQAEWNKLILELPLEKMSKYMEEMANYSSILSTQMDEYSTALGAVNQYIEDQKQVYQDQLDALNKQNEARRIQLGIEQASYDLERNSNQRTNKVKYFAHYLSNKVIASSYIG